MSEKFEVKQSKNGETRALLPLIFLLSELEGIGVENIIRSCTLNDEDEVKIRALLARGDAPSREEINLMKEKYCSGISEDLCVALLYDTVCSCLMGISCEEPF